MARLSSDLECFGLKLIDPVLELKTTIDNLENGGIARITTPVSLSSTLNPTDIIVMKDGSGNVYYIKHYRLNELLAPNGNVSLSNGSTRYKLINVGDPTNPYDGATKKYVDDMVTGWIWQQKVLDVVTALPTESLTTGDRYLVIGSVETYDNSIMEWDGDSWVESEPLNNWAVEAIDDHSKYVYSDTLGEWIEFTAFNYTAGNGIDITESVISVLLADGTDLTYPQGSGLVFDIKGGIVVNVSGVLAISDNQIFLDYNSNNFVNIGGELTPLQLVYPVANSVLTATFKETGEHINATEIDITYNNTLENNSGLGVKVAATSSIEKGTLGLDVKLLDDGGISRNSQGELYADNDVASFEYTFTIAEIDLGTLKAISLSTYNADGGDVRSAHITFKEIVEGNEVPANLLDYQYTTASIPTHIYMDVPDNDNMIGRQYKVIIK